MSYIVRRLLSGLVIVFALTWITFALFWLLPAEPWRAVVTDPVPTKAEITAANHKLGVDRPVVVQYGKFVWGIVRHGSFGRDYYANEPVTTFLKQALPVTWSIVLGGVILLFILALPLATVLGVMGEHRGRPDHPARSRSPASRCTRSSSGSACAASSRTGSTGCPAYYYCPLRGSTEISTLDPGDFTYKYTSCGGPGAWASHLALPWLTFAVIFLPLYVRMLRGAIVEVLEQPYVLTAHAKGAGQLRVLRVARPPERDAAAADDDRDGDRPRADGLDLHRDDVHASTAPASSRSARSVTHPGSRVGATEPRRGSAGRRRTVQPARTRRRVFMIALTVIVLNLIVDVTYAYLDPRIRLSGRSAEAPADGHVRTSC